MREARVPRAGSSRRKALRRAVVVTLDLAPRAAIAVGLVGLISLEGCGGESERAEDAKACPASEPSGACSAGADLHCGYGGVCGSTYVCSSGKWLNVGNACNPPMPGCPPSSTPLPKQSQSCPVGGTSATCSFTASCGLMGSARCNGVIYVDVVDPCFGADAAPDTSTDADLDAAGDAAGDAPGDAG